MKKVSKPFVCLFSILAAVTITSCSLIQAGRREEIESLPGSVRYTDFTSSVPELYAAARESLAAGDFSEAEALYNQIITSEPDSPHGYIGLGASLYYQDRLEEARDAYHQATQLSPSSAMAFIGLGSAAYSQGDFQAAEMAYTEALELDETIADAHLGMGLVLGKLEQYEAAAAHLERFLELAPDTRQRASVRALIADYQRR